MFLLSKKEHELSYSDYENLQVNKNKINKSHSKSRKTFSTLEKIKKRFEPEIKRKRKKQI